MQDGFLFLSILAGVASLAAWFYVEISLAREGGFQSRRQVTGYELARQVLDANQHPRTAINPAVTRGRLHFGFQWDQLLLGENVYYGTRLVDLAATLHEVSHLLAASKSLIPAALRPQGRFFRIVITGAWLLILSGILLPGRGLNHLGQFLLILTFFLSCASLGEEWEVTERAVGGLKQLDGFETGERVRLRRLLKAILWIPVAEIFDAPISVLLPKKGKVRADHALSKSKRVH